MMWEYFTKDELKFASSENANSEIILTASSIKQKLLLCSGDNTSINWVPDFIIFFIKSY